ncbi:Outer membrane protein assembly factor YaeT [hydrothermal vent metagenome]|uniref:Outer membrane protein assembly factor YaeT n=1 Tax=hydrothermal vent metagenome TaxID=652676 RepID=A0A3B1A0W2_9ZZZZ
MYKFNKLGLAVFGALYFSNAYAFDEFKVRDIRLEGLQRISLGTVFNYLPIKIGDNFTSKLSSQAIKALYKTGSFKDINFEREGDVLVIFVAERPAISEIKFEGNDDIQTDSLENVLKQIGLIKGRVFDPSVLERMKQELKRQYYSLGKYSVKVDTEITTLERNRVNVQIKIAEGDSAEIHAINIVGNKKFNNEKLLSRFESAGTGFFGGKKQYSKQILSGDLEKLKSYYLDRGYINFSVNSTQVSISPDKEDIYITINVSEGESYNIREVKLIGDFIIKESELRKLVPIQVNEVFSRKKTSKSRSNITEKLSSLGYAFSNVNVIPDIDNDSKTVALNLYIDPGRRVYVRRVNVSGNTKTKDEVVRREIRQMENGWLSTDKVAQSRTRLNRLGYFESVNVETPPVQGTNDQVDVNYKVSERPTGQITAGLGFSDTQGVILNFGLSQDNFVGTGKRVAINIDNSQVTKRYSLSINDPYYTIDGVSRGFTVFSRQVDTSRTNIVNYVTNSLGGSLNFGIPLTENQFMNFSLGYDDTELVTGSNTVKSIVDFTEENGNQFVTYTVSSSWQFDNRDRSLFATKGNKTRVTTELAVPGGDLEYYKLGFQTRHFFTFASDWTVMANLELGTGAGYGDTSRLPPYKNYFVGGSRSVRGYNSGSIGSPNTKELGISIGGSSRILSNLELVLPSGSENTASGFRFSLFVDSGFVYAQQDKVDIADVRSSYGVSAIWLAPIGILRFSLAAAIDQQPADDLQSFQFTLGSAF